MPNKKGDETEFLNLSKKGKYLVFMVNEDDSGIIGSITVYRNKINYLEEVGLLTTHLESLASEVNAEKISDSCINKLQQVALESSMLTESVPLGASRH